MSSKTSIGLDSLSSLGEQRRLPHRSVGTGAVGGKDSGRRARHAAACALTPSGLGSRRGGEALLRLGVLGP